MKHDLGNPATSSYRNADDGRCMNLSRLPLYTLELNRKTEVVAKWRFEICISWACACFVITESEFLKRLSRYE